MALITNSRLCTVSMDKDNVKLRDMISSHNPTLVRISNDNIVTLFHQPNAISVVSLSSGICIGISGVGTDHIIDAYTTEMVVYTDCVNLKIITLSKNGVLVRVSIRHNREDNKQEISSWVLDKSCVSITSNGSMTVYLRSDGTLVRLHINGMKTLNLPNHDVPINWSRARVWCTAIPQSRTRVVVYDDSRVVVFRKNGNSYNVERVVNQRNVQYVECMGNTIMMFTSKGKVVQKSIDRRYSCSYSGYYSVCRVMADSNRLVWLASRIDGVNHLIGRDIRNVNDPFIFRRVLQQVKVDMTHAASKSGDTQQVKSARSVGT